MVLTEVRAELRNALIALVEGRLSNDGFDAVYYRHCVGSADAAVAQIGRFGWGLYSSDLLWCYYLRGRHAVSEDMSCMAERCRLFLDTRFEYRWPSFPSFRWAEVIASLVAAPGGIAIFMMPILVPLALSNGGLGAAASIAALGFIVTISGLLACLWFRGYRARRLAAYWSGGPQAVWPFGSELEYQQAVAGSGPTSLWREYSPQVGAVMNAQCV